MRKKLAVETNIFYRKGKDDILFVYHRIQRLIILIISIKENFSSYGFDRKHFIISKNIWSSTVSVEFFTFFPLNFSILKKIYI